jgi:hypothetical protein
MNKKAQKHQQKNTFESRGLEEYSVISILETTAGDGGEYLKELAYE